MALPPHPFLLPQGEKELSGKLFPFKSDSGAQSASQTSTPANVKLCESPSKAGGLPSIN